MLVAFSFCYIRLCSDKALAMHRKVMLAAIAVAARGNLFSRASIVGFHARTLPSGVRPTFSV